MIQKQKQKPKPRLVGLQPWWELYVRRAIFSSSLAKTFPLSSVKDSLEQDSVWAHSNVHYAGSFSQLFLPDLHHSREDYRSLIPRHSGSQVLPSRSTGLLFPKEIP